MPAIGASAIVAMKKIGRNDPCRCGSGKKYKQCCMQLDLAQAAIRRAELQSIHRDIEAALKHHQAKRLPESEAIYRRILEVEPNHPDALHFLGVIASQQGKGRIAVELIRKSLSFKPDNAPAHANLGNALQGLGLLEEALLCYHKALRLKPDFAEAHYNLGNVLKKQSKFDQAAACYRKAFSLKPDFAEAYGNLGNILGEQGRLDEAIASYRKALSLKSDLPEVYYSMGDTLKEQGRLDDAIASYHMALLLRPEFTEAHNSLGTALRQQGKLDAAVESYRKALSIKPDYAPAHVNLGNALRRLDQPDAALASYVNALEAEELADAKLGFVACLRNAKFVQDDAVLRRLVTRAMSEPWGRPHELATVSTALIKFNKNILECVERASLAWPTRLSGLELYGPAGLSPFAADPLLRCLLENTPSLDIGLERFLTMARLAMLHTANVAAASDEVGEEVLGFQCALARQCFINEYVFACTDGELGQARLLREKLATSLASESPIPMLWLVTVAAYFPLVSIPSAEALLKRSWPDAVTALLVQQVREPLEEQQYRAFIPMLTAVEDDVSRLVRQQYEQNPYPRWVKTPTVGRVVSIDAYLRQQFPFSPFAPLGNSGEVEILVAGCGTGRETIETAQQFGAARVLAVDLSLTSLCYATRKTRELGLENIEYAQADIMELGSMGRMFDVIQSVGVLHHLADPLQGWRVLLSLLRRGGFMRLGFYSELGRQDVVAAQSFVAGQEYVASDENIRSCRQKLMSMKDDSNVKKLVSRTDFYGTSQCRDLIFHVQEHRFTLPQIQRQLGELALHFIGFSLEPHILRRYSERFPEDKTMTDLDSWNAFEAENPDTFSGMYQFWVQRPIDPTSAITRASRHGSAFLAQSS
jgi:tetratricopeptide (TPR) repeat protein/2-polyprenyl-3-methyl-5-hydroxy-6-metoxy-1,4-benzoquinol methylase